MITQSLKSFSTGRLFAAGSSLLRGFCAATSLQAETAVEAVEHASSTGVSADKEDSMSTMWRLYRGLSAVGATGDKVADVLDGYVREGHVVRKDDLLDCVRKLRNYKRHHHCLEIFEWMDKLKYNNSHRDNALRLDLVCKTKGIAEAEKFFESLSAENKNLYTYGALLNCYCTEKLSDKAAELLKEMEKLNYVSSLTFNNLMTLALRSEEPEKVPGLAEEMKRRNFPMNSYSYSLLMQSYQLLNDMEAVDRTLQEIEKGGKNCHWSVYSNLAAVYIRAGNSEKAEIALKKLEELELEEMVVNEANDLSDDDLEDSDDFPALATLALPPPAVHNPKPPCPASVVGGVPIQNSNAHGNAAACINDGRGSKAGMAIPPSNAASIYDGPSSKAGVAFAPVNAAFSQDVPTAPRQTYFEIRVVLLVYV